MVTLSTLPLLILGITILANTLLGLTAIGTSYADNPLYVGGCYWDEANSPPKDPADRGGGETSQEALDEIIMPTNQTSTDAFWGDANPFNAITDFTESASKTLETIKNYIGGGYIMGVISNVTVGCELVEGDNPATSGIVEDWYYVSSSNAVWDEMMSGMEYFVIFLNIITIVAFVRGTTV